MRRTVDCLVCGYIRHVKIADLSQIGDPAYCASPQTRQSTVRADDSCQNLLLCGQICATGAARKTYTHQKFPVRKLVECTGEVQFPVCGRSMVAALFQSLAKPRAAYHGR